MYREEVPATQGVVGVAAVAEEGEGAAVVVKAEAEVRKVVGETAKDTSTQG